MMEPLEGIRILDLTRVLAGPFTTMILGDLGAEVIKIEIPESGDDSRGYGPFVKGESAYFMSLNRNKKSLTLNLKKERGRRIFKELVKLSDVVVENFKPGTMDKLGIGYNVLKAINPRIIYAACSGFGSTGPYSQKPAYDIIVQAMGGIMSITGEPDGAPVRVGTSAGDIFAGLYAAIGILAALHARSKTGSGQKVDVGMLDCQVAVLENAVARYLITGEIPAPLGTRHPSITPFEAFKSKDYYVVIAIGNESLWEKFCRVINKPGLAHDERFRTNHLRTQNHDQLKPIIEQITAAKSTEEWMRILEAEGIPCSPINTIDKVVNDPQIRFRDMIVEIEHPAAGKLEIPGIPVKLSATRGRIRTPAPLLGQHTEEILSRLLDMSREEITQLRKEKVI